MRPVLLLFLFSSIITFSFGQDFYKDYREYRIIILGKRSDSAYNKRYIDTAIKYLKQDFTEFERRTGHSFLSQNTLYIVSFPDLGDHLSIVWNKKWSFSSTYETYNVDGYDYSCDRQEKIGASEILKKLPNKVKRAIKHGDTIYFIDHAKEFRVLDSWVISFTRAIRTKTKWKFVSALSYDIDL
ncbi:MAG: hypothetical protein ABJA76_03885 [Mucilaginibacter sp.]